MADDVTLLPCPFCGAPAELGVREWPGGAKDYWVWCSRYSATDPHGCFATTREHQDPDNAIAAWNTRVSDPRIAALEAELADARDCIDLFNRMIVRAECAWKEQHPDSEFYPDVPDLIVWLKEQVDALKERRCETCEWWQSRQADWGYCYHDERGQKWLGNDSCPLWEAKGTRGGQ